MNIYLIGYRCTGKTTVAKSLSEKLGWGYLDADVKLTEEYGMTISDIVQKEGWPGFRKKEKKILQEIVTYTGHAVATGGGVILDPDNVEMMKETGVVVWLKASPETIYFRMMNDRMTESQRPSLTDKKLEQEIRDTLNERTPLYEGAMNFSIETDHQSLDAVVQQMTDRLFLNYLKRG